jgi:hypothetical protein
MPLLCSFNSLTAWSYMAVSCKCNG